MTVVRHISLLHDEYIPTMGRMERASDDRIDPIRGFRLRRRKIRCFLDAKQFELICERGPLRRIHPNPVKRDYNQRALTNRLELHKIKQPIATVMGCSFIKIQFIVEQIDETQMFGTSVLRSQINAPSLNSRALQYTSEKLHDGLPDKLC